MGSIWIISNIKLIIIILISYIDQGCFNPAPDYKENLNPKLITPMTVDITSIVDSPFFLSRPWWPRIGFTYPCHYRDRDRDDHHVPSHARDSAPKAVLFFLSFLCIPSKLYMMKYLFKIDTSNT